MMAFSQTTTRSPGTSCSSVEDAWNEGSGAKFASPFTAAADFVDIRGDHHRGAEPIAAGHDSIFQSIYRGNRMRYTLAKARRLCETSYSSTPPAISTRRPAR
jgi:uncharacterized protein (TIGR02246 family)